MGEFCGGLWLALVAPVVSGLILGASVYPAHSRTWGNDGKFRPGLYTAVGFIDVERDGMLVKGVDNPEIGRKVDRRKNMSLTLNILIYLY